MINMLMPWLKPWLHCHVTRYVCAAVLAWLAAYSHTCLQQCAALATHAFSNVQP